MDGGRRSSREVARDLCEFIPGETFKYILKQFESCGYEVSWRVVNSRHWLPQFRERVYMVGFRSDLKDKTKPFNWHAVHGVSNQEEQKQDVELSLQRMQRDHHHRQSSLNRGTLDSNVPPVSASFLGAAEEATDGEDASSSSSSSVVRTIMQDNIECSYIEDCELTEQQWLQVTKAVEKLSEQSKLKLEENSASTATLKENDPKKLRSIPIDSKMPCIVSGYHRATSHTTKFIFEEKNGMVRDGVGGNKRPRFLTPRECARLMGFPDSFIIPDENSEKGRGLFYKQIGNAVCPPVIEAIGRQILISLGMS
jgi:DNA-cytosine methyltransferase